MKYSCEIIRDLLPLYSDEVCSEESSQIVREHIAECEDCRNMLEKMNQEIKVENLDNDVKQIKSLAKKWKQSKITSFIWGATIAFIIGFTVLLIASVIGYYSSGGSYISSDGIVHENFQYVFVGFWAFVLMVLGFVSLLIQMAVQRAENNKRYKKISAILLVVCIILFIATQVIFGMNSKVLPDGRLVEPFYLIPIGYILFLVGLMSAVSLVINIIYGKCKKAPK
ncbi:MAG: DUF3955 domain-containing protein [Clostridium sp.]|uniref:DUF3955 domain-containing protein n=1 Tax=Clostridium sp. TaxID=1506 RepID=UPI003EE49861